MAENISKTCNLKETEDGPLVTNNGGNRKSEVKELQKLSSNEEKSSNFSSDTGLKNEKENSIVSPLEDYTHTVKKNENRSQLTDEDDQDTSSEVVKLQIQSSSQGKPSNLSETDLNKLDQIIKDLLSEASSLKKSEDIPSLIEDDQERSSEIIDFKNQSPDLGKPTNFSDIDQNIQEEIPHKDPSLEDSTLKENEDISSVKEVGQERSSEVTKLLHQYSNQAKPLNINESEHKSLVYISKDPALEDSTLKEIEDGSQIIENDRFRNDEFIELQTLTSNQGKSSTSIESNLNDEDEISASIIGPSFIPMLIVELVLSLIDFLSDLLTGYSLLKLKDKVWAGIVSFVINWVPGVIAAIQILANQRCENVATTIMYCLACLVLCPIVPTISFVYLFFKVPRNSQEEKSREIVQNFQKVLSFVMIVRALEGCIESPLQLLYKTFLMFNGIIDFNFTSPDFAFQDLHGNNIPVPFIINFVISSLTLIKSVYGLNIPHFKTKANSKFPALLSKADFVGFLVASTLFKLSSLILLLGYFNVYTILPMIIIILAGSYANFLTIRDFESIPNWLMVFMNLFVPICFTPKDDEDISKAQAENLKLQTLICFITYGLALILLGLLVYFSELNMNPDIPINFEMFGILVTTSFGLGILAVVFSFRLELQDSTETWKKIFFSFAKIFRLATLLGVVVSSTSLFVITPGSQSYLTIWNNSKPTAVFKTYDITYLENSVMNLSLKDLEIIKREDIFDKQSYEIQNHSKVAIVLNNQPLKPSSPKTFHFEIPTLILQKEDRERFVKMTNDSSKQYSIQISKECKWCHDLQIPMPIQSQGQGR